MGEEVDGGRGGWRWRAFSEREIVALGMPALTAQLRPDLANKPMRSCPACHLMVEGEEVAKLVEMKLMGRQIRISGYGKAMKGGRTALDGYKSRRHWFLS